MLEGMDVVKGDIIENGLRWHERYVNSPGDGLSGVFDYLLRGRYGEQQLATIGLNSGFTMFRRALLERIDGFDGRFRGWFDDFDTGLRLWLVGARMCHDPRPVAVHYRPDEGGRRSFDENKYMHRNAARWTFMIQHFGEQSAREDYLAAVIRTISDVVRRKVPLSRLKNISHLTRSWKRARVVAASAPQLLSNPLPEHRVIEEASARFQLSKAS
jgi:GT2 family glycosyltransferase